MKTITLRKLEDKYLVNVFGIRGQQGRENNTIIFDSEFNLIANTNDVSQIFNTNEIAKEICTIGGVRWKNNEVKIGELIKRVVINNVKGYTKHSLLMQEVYYSVLPPLASL